MVKEVKEAGSKPKTRFERIRADKSCFGNSETEKNHRVKKNKKATKKKAGKVNDFTFRTRTIPEN